MRPNHATETMILKRRLEYLRLCDQTRTKVYAYEPNPSHLESDFADVRSRRKLIKLLADLEKSAKASKQE